MPNQTDTDKFGCFIDPSTILSLNFGLMLLTAFCQSNYIFRGRLFECSYFDYYKLV